MTSTEEEQTARDAFAAVLADARIAVRAFFPEAEPTPATDLRVLDLTTFEGNRRH